MNIIKNKKLDLKALKAATAKPELHQKSTHKFWDDSHISNQMLQFHLNPEVEAASKTKETIEAEANFIVQITGLNEKMTLLDLGCGPGLYVKAFAKTGASVTGIDLSPRSIQYALDHRKTPNEHTTFAEMNYLDMDYKDSFDVATLIFYDFCALSTAEQRKLLSNVHCALKEKGVFIFDVVSENKKTTTITANEVCDQGFWSPEPYLEILNTFIYEEPKTEGLQYTLINEDGDVKIIRIYHRLFALDEIALLLEQNGFKIEKIFNNLKGDPLTKDSETYGIVACKV